jgi:hypothetical protein
VLPNILSKHMIFLYTKTQFGENLYPLDSILNVSFDIFYPFFSYLSLFLFFLKVVLKIEICEFLVCFLQESYFKFVLQFKLIGLKFP